MDPSQLLKKSPRKYTRRGSGRMCAVVGCSNSEKLIYFWRNARCTIHSDRLHKYCDCLMPFKLHKFPENEEDKMTWVTKLNRQEFKVNSNSRICNKHFVDGEPTEKYPYPECKLGYEPKMTKGRRKRQLASELVIPKKKTKQEMPGSQIEAEIETTPATQDSHAETAGSNDPAIISPLCKYCGSATVSALCEYCGFEQCICEVHPDYKTWDKQVTADHPYFNFKKHPKSQSTQYSVFDTMDDAYCKLMTGIEKVETLTEITTMMQKYTSRRAKLPSDEQILLVLMRLKLGLLFEDLGYRFNIKTKHASYIFKRLIKPMAQVLRTMIVWFPKKLILESCPLRFRLRYPNVTSIIDCFELFSQMPTKLFTRAQLYSHYKHHQTVKYLISITPAGYISFISSGYSGRASDKHVVLDSGYLDMLRPGVDDVMADRGFTIRDELIQRGVKLVIPAFTKGKTQLSENEVLTTRRIANVRIHVERAIRRLKTFRLLKYEIPVCCMPVLDDCVTVVTALCNLKNPLIKYLGA